MKFKVYQYSLIVIILVTIFSCQNNESDRKVSWTKNFLLPPPNWMSFSVDIDGDGRKDTIEIDEYEYYKVKFTKLDTIIIFPFPIEFTMYSPLGDDSTFPEERIDTNNAKIYDFDNDGKFELYGRVFTYKHHTYEPDTSLGLTTNHMVIEYENDKINIHSIPWSTSVYQFYNAKKFDNVKELILKRQGKKFGYVDKKGKWVILPELDNGYNFNCERALVEQNEIRYVINKRGEILLELKSHHYTQADTFSNTCFLTMMGCLTECSDMCLIDTTGNFIKFREQNCLSDIRQFNEGLASAAIGENEKWGYVNKKFEWVIPPKYDVTYTFHNGIGMIRNNGIYQYINKKGELKPIVYENGKAKVILFSKEHYLYENGKFEEIK